VPVTYACGLPLNDPLDAWCWRLCHSVDAALGASGNRLRTPPQQLCRHATPRLVAPLGSVPAGTDHRQLAAKIAIPVLPSVVAEMAEVTSASTAQIIDADKLEKSAAVEVGDLNGEDVPTVPAQHSLPSSQASVPLMTQVGAKQVLFCCWLAGIIFGVSGFILAALR
jgi:hypothetical protein